MQNLWEGGDYKSHRLLLLGESAYSWVEDSEVIHPSPRHAAELVEGALGAFPCRLPFVDKLSRAITGYETPDRAMIEFAWAKVAFTNYIAESVGHGARVRPGAEMWKRAEARFKQLLHRLEPANIIVLGKTLWSEMPDPQIHLTDDVQGYLLSNGNLAMCWVLDHPSAGLSWKRLADVVQFAQERRISLTSSRQINS